MFRRRDSYTSGAGPTWCRGLRLQPGRVHTPPSHHLMTKGRGKKSPNPRHQSQENSIFSPVLTASEEKRLSLSLPANTESVWEETKMKSVERRRRWKKASANNGPALCDITHGRSPIAVCFSTHFQSYGPDCCPFMGGLTDRRKSETTAWKR